MKRQLNLIPAQPSDQFSNYFDKAANWLFLVSHFVVKWINLYPLVFKLRTSIWQRCLLYDRKERYLNGFLVRLVLLALLFTGLFHHAAYAQDNSIKVAVAANLLLPMQEVKKLYEEKYNSKLILIPGSSGKLTAQILNGAPYDIFLSADMKYPCQVLKEGQAAKEPEVLVRGRLVFWSKKKPAEPLSQWLVDADIQSLAIAQPELAPYGQRAKDWLTEKGIYAQLLPKIIFGESIGQVNQYIRSGTVESAFTAISAMRAEEMKDIGYWQPLTVYSGDPSRLDHGMVLLKNAAASEPVIQQFLAFITSAQADKVFQDFGYEVTE